MFWFRNQQPDDQPDRCVSWLLQRKQFLLGSFPSFRLTFFSRFQSFMHFGCFLFSLLLPATYLLPITYYLLPIKNIATLVNPCPCRAIIFHPSSSKVLLQQPSPNLFSQSLLGLRLALLFSIFCVSFLGSFVKLRGQ